jgi:ribosomal protein L17
MTTTNTNTNTNTAAPKKAAFRKNDVVELLTTLHASRIAQHDSFIKQASNDQVSADERAELLKTAKTNATHAKYLERMTSNSVLLEAVASQVVQLKITADQINEIERDAYSMRKFAELMISFAQKRKVSDEHSFGEALAVIASGVTDSDAVSFGKKMTNKEGGAYGARQAQMSLKLLERLNACTVKQDGRNKLFCMNQDSAVFKRIMSAYE